MYLMPRTIGVLHMPTTPSTARHIETGCNERRLPRICAMKHAGERAFDEPFDRGQRGEGIVQTPTSSFPHPAPPDILPP